MMWQNVVHARIHLHLNWHRQLVNTFIPKDRKILTDKCRLRAHSQLNVNLNLNWPFKISYYCVNFQPPSLKLFLICLLAGWLSSIIELYPSQVCTNNRNNEHWTQIWIDIRVLNEFNCENRIFASFMFPCTEHRSNEIFD